MKLLCIIDEGHTRPVVGTITTQYVVSL